MPGKNRVNDARACVQVELTIPVRQTGRVQNMGKAGVTEPKAPRIPRVTRLMALAIKFQDMVDRGEVRDYADLARLGHITRARMSQIMNLLLLAPDIQECLLFCHAPAAVNERGMRELSAEIHWAEQRIRWTSIGGPAGACVSERQ